MIVFGLFIMSMLNIYTHKERLAIQLSENTMKGSLIQLKKHVVSMLGFTSQLHLYHQPLTTFSRLDFMAPTAAIRDIVDEFGEICFTFNNRQHMQEPQFLYPLPKSSNDLLIVAQTCNENVFTYDRYKIDSKARISFLKSLTQRIGQNVYILYYQLRVPVEQFNNQENIFNTIAKLAYPNHTVIVTADQEQLVQLYRTVQNPCLVDFDQYYLICIEDEEKQMVMDRRADWSVVIRMLQIIFKTNLQIKDHKQHGQINFQVTKNTNRVTLVKKNKSIALNPALQLSFFVGQTSHYLVFLQQSQTLHIYSRRYPFEHINSVVLCCEASNYLDEEIPVLLGNELIMYQVTVTCMILKHYSLPSGELQFVRHFKWEKSYGTVRLDTLDIISAPLGLRLLRVFYIYAPHDYFELMQPDIDWFVFVSKWGNNILSDGSGLFALGGFNRDEFDIYNLKTKSKIAAIRFSKFPLTVISMSFNAIDKRILITTNDNCYEHSFGGELIQSIIRQSGNTIYCYGLKGKIFAATPYTFQFLHSPTLRIKEGVVIHGSLALSFNPQLQPGAFKQIYSIQESQ